MAVAKLYIVGLGPGKPEGMTLGGARRSGRADLLCGYGAYLELLAPLYPDKERFSTPMTQELERCRRALDEARRGRTVALVCSGDAGVYGMASPVLELLPEYPGVEVEIVAGVTAALSGAAVLGAPLGHDFCVISLSDLLTPWDVIEKRLRSAAEGDFAICLYNPASKKREDYLRRACDILLAVAAADTLCGWLKNIGRAGRGNAPADALGAAGGGAGHVYHRVHRLVDHAGDRRAHGDAEGVSTDMNVMIFGGTTEGRALSHRLTCGRGAR